MSWIVFKVGRLKLGLPQGLRTWRIALLSCDLQILGWLNLTHWYPTDKETKPWNFLYPPLQWLSYLLIQPQHQFCVPLLAWRTSTYSPTLQILVCPRPSSPFQACHSWRISRSEKFPISFLLIWTFLSHSPLLKQLSLTNAYFLQSIRLKLSWPRSERCWTLFTSYLFFSPCTTTQNLPEHSTTVLALLLWRMLQTILVWRRMT